jgi:hypothetical protein
LATTKTEQHQRLLRLIESALTEVSSEGRQTVEVSRMVDLLLDVRTLAVLAAPARAKSR